MKLSRICGWCIGLWMAGICLGQEERAPSQGSMLAGLRPEHPRILATARDFAAIREICATHPEAARWLERLKADARKLIDTPPLKYEIPDGKRLLAVSRAAKERLLLLGLMHRLTGEKDYARRAWIELDTITHFKDWNPSHFLDTAEMTFAAAIGYDWLHEAWSETQKTQIRQAMVKMGLEEGLKIYRKRSGWTKADHNWNQVCNGGMGTGALAIAESEPKLAAEALHGAVLSLPRAMKSFAPDGGWGEGPGYWDYATEYNVYLLAALKTALGRDFGLSGLPGFSVTGDFPMHFVGPGGKTFNFADAHDGWKGANQLFWLAEAFNQPAYAAWQMTYARRDPSALDLLWGAAWLAKDPKTQLPAASRAFAGVDVVTIRSAWNDPQAIFIGLKGGDNQVNHSHLDLGSFVLEAGGVRWAIDLGPDNYNIPGYFGDKRWTYYRLTTAGHNTLLINGQNQATAAKAPILRFAAGSGEATAVVDLSAAYPAAKRVWRGVAMREDQVVIIQDEIESGNALEAAWRMHTEAEVAVNGARATLSQGGKTLHARILQPPGAGFAVENVQVPKPQNPIRDVRCLTATAGGRVRSQTLVIALSLDEAATQKARSPGELAGWGGGRKR